MSLKIGKNDYISNSEYHGDRQFISSTGLKLAYKDMREFYNQYVLGDMSNAPTGAQLDFGNLLHSMILEPEKNLSDFAFFDGRKYGAVWDKFKAENISKIIMSNSQLDKAKSLFDKFKASKLLLDTDNGTVEIPYLDFFTGGEAEATYAAEIDGIKVKVKTDYIKNNIIYDLKTTGEESLSKDVLKNVCDRWSYEISAALYTDVISQITNAPTGFYFVFLSTSSGKVKIVKASEKMLTEGREKYKIGINNIKNARSTGIYFKNEIEEI